VDTFERTVLLRGGIEVVLGGVMPIEEESLCYALYFSKWRWLPVLDLHLQ